MCNKQAKSIEEKMERSAYKLRAIGNLLLWDSPNDSLTSHEATGIDYLLEDIADEMDEAGKEIVKLRKVEAIEKAA